MKGIPESRASEKRILFSWFGIPLTIEIRNPRSNEKESEIQNLEFGTQSVQSRI